jgi:hypothetical protein
MTNRLFAVSGNKISSLLIDDDSLKFSSSKFTSADEFREGWNKKISLSTKTEVKFDKIKSVRKEENDEDIMIKYKTVVGVTGECEFKFENQSDNYVFFDYLQKVQLYQKVNEKLSPFKAIKGFLTGLGITIAIIVFCYFHALDMANGTAEESHSGKGRMLNKIVEILGDKGVLIVGGAITAYLIYQIYKRYKNPPNMVSLLPPNSNN